MTCGPEDAPLTEECPFGVARAGGGYATVWTGRPDGGSRTIYFRMGVPIGASFAEAEGGEADFQTDRRDDHWFIWVGGYVYEVPDAVVLGG